jgi:hypothetical protein
MFRASILASIGVLTVAVAVTAQSQDRPAATSLVGRNVLGLGLEPALYPKVVLFRRPEIQEELKVTPAQKAQYANLQKEEEEFSERLSQETEKKRQELDPEEFAAFRASIYPSTAPFREEVEAKLLKILDRRQRIRLDQIQIQADGPMAFKRSDFQERLNLSPGQVELITPIVDQGRQEIRNAAVVKAEVMPLGLTAEQRRDLTKSEKFKSEVGKKRDAVVKARLTTMQVIAKHLTKGQRANYEKMVGEPFDFLKMQARRDAKAGEPKPEPK